MFYHGLTVDHKWVMDHTKKERTRVCLCNHLILAVKCLCVAVKCVHVRV